MDKENTRRGMAGTDIGKHMLDLQCIRLWNWFSRGLAAVVCRVGMVAGQFRVRDIYKGIE